MQEAVTLFPHSISHSNNGDRLISIEFLPLFNRFTVLFELSKHSSKASFQIPALLLFSSPYDQSSLDYTGGFGEKKERNKKKQQKMDKWMHFLNAKERNDSATYIHCINSFEHQGILRKRRAYLELNSTYVTRRKNKAVSSNVTLRSCSLKEVTRQLLSVTYAALVSFYS